MSLDREEAVSWNFTRSCWGRSLGGWRCRHGTRKRPVVATRGSADSWILLKSAFSTNRRINGVLGSWSRSRFGEVAPFFWPWPPPSPHEAVWREVWGDKGDELGRSVVVHRSTSVQETCSPFLRLLPRLSPELVPTAACFSLFKSHQDPWLHKNYSNFLSSNVG